MPYSLTLPLIMAEWLSSGRRGRLILDSQQKVIWHNARADEYMRRTEAFRIERETFVLANKRDQSGLSNFIESNRPDTMILLRDDDDKPTWTLQVERISVDPAPITFGIRITDAADFRAGDFLHFRTEFDLTNQEEAICRMKLKGMTVQDIVKAEQKSPDTIRFHIRNIYRKTGVNSREELFAYLRLFLFS